MTPEEFAAMSQAERAYFDERAARMEFDGGKSREDAERAAAAELAAMRAVLESDAK